MIKKILLFLFFVLFFTGVYPVNGEIVTTGDDQQSISLTIYNSDLALVRDTRKINPGKGEQVLAFKEISSKIMPETALIAGKNIDVIEQNFEFDLLTPATLLNKYVGKTVILARSNEKTGEQRINATVLSTANGVVLKIGNQIETSVDGRLIYPDVPKNLREKPTLTMLLNSEKSGERSIALTYLTRGLSWKADYVAQLNSDDSRLDLKGWVTLTNQSGTRYDRAKLQLVAGDVNRAVPKTPIPVDAERMVMRAAVAPASRIAEESLLEYHLYTVNRPTTVKENQSKQIALLEEENGICQKKYTLMSGSPHFYWNKTGRIYTKKSIDVSLEFKNDKASNFGTPKPAGTIRVYKKDSAGFFQFVGEDNISHTPENEQVEIQLGRAFDVTADRKQTDFIMKKATQKNLRIYESAYEIKLKNAKDKDVTVNVMETLPGDWQMISQSHEHVKKSAAAVSWKMAVPAKGSTTLTFRVRSTM